MSKFNKFNRIIRGSMRYEFEGTVLTVTDYYSGDRISIDLAEMSEEEFEAIVVVDEDDEDDEE